MASNYFSCCFGAKFYILHRIFIAVCKSVLLYGSKAWTIAMAQEKSLYETYTAMLYMVLGVSWKDRVRSEAMSRMGSYQSYLTRSSSSGGPYGDFLLDI